MNDYYVYVFLREDKFSPYYVGKGRGRRLYNGWGRVTRRPKDPNRIVKIKENLSEFDAFALETILIKFWGRLDNNTGVLRNRTDGGDGTPGMDRSGESNGMYGRKHSPETIQKMREARAGQDKGRKLSAETRQKMSIARKKLYQDNPELKSIVIESNKKRRGMKYAR